MWLATPSLQETPSAKNCGVNFGGELYIKTEAYSVPQEDG